MMASGQKLNLRLFLEGIEVPVIGAAIQANVNSPATASVQVIPTDRILELKPRTMVHLFYWNFNNDLPDGGGTVVPDNSDPNFQLKNYRLGFTGEVVGLVFMKTPVGRQAILQCADFSTYWDTTYQIFISYSPDGNFLEDTSSVWAGGNSMFDNISSSHSGVLNSYLNSRPQSEGLKDVKGLMGGIIALLEAMGGVPNHTSGVNDFFTIAELKNHLLQQITAEQNDDTAQRLFDSKAFSEWLNRGVTSMGELVSFRDMLKLLFHWIYYEVIPITSPMFIKAVPPTTTETVSNNKTLANSLALSESQRSAIRDWLTITNRYDGTEGPETSLRNQLLADEVLAVRDLATQIRRMLGGPQGVEQAPISLTKADGSKQDISFDTPQILPDAQIPARAKTLLGFIESQKGSIGATSGKFTTEQIVSASITNGRGKINADVTQLQANQRLWKSFTKNLMECLSLKTPAQAPNSSRKQVKTRPVLDRLQTQIFRPDCFFVPPPRCNVLFPDQVTQFQFQRNFLQEITRLRLAVGLEFITGPGASLLTPLYYAPPLSQIADIAKKQGNAGIRTLLPWEKFTGILPKFESISEINYIANRRQRQLQENVKGKGADYSQRSASFNFLKYRFSPRSLSISAKFTPQFVMGFPGLVIDKPFIIDPSSITSALTQAGVANAPVASIGDIVKNIDLLAKYFKAPTQYLGMPASLMHNIDQSGGTTNITFTHARTHRLTDDDFLQSYTAEITKKTQIQSVSTVLDADELLRAGDYKRLQFLIDATPQDQVAIATSAQTIQFDSDNENPLDVADAEPELDLRPNGAPNLVTFDQLAPAIFSTPNPTFSSGSPIQGTSPTTNPPSTPADDLLNQEFPGQEILRWIGPTTRTQLKGTRTTILAPNPYAKLKPGSKGPKGGSVTQIQLFSNSVASISSVDLSGFVHTAQDKKDLATRRKNAGKSDTIFLWRKAVIWESLTTKTVDKPIPVEETIRPPWFSPLYSNLFIGDNIYQPFFGTGSIVDEGLFITPEGGALFGSSSDRDEVLAQVQAADGDSVKISQILDKFKATTIGSIPSIENSVDSLSYLYGEVCRQELDVQRFIINYTDRPIATLFDMLGSLDLAYEVQGEKLVKTSGTAGFHSTAVAPFGDLLGLLDNPDLQLARMQRDGKKFPISKVLDPRPDRRAAVQAYANDFGSNGSLGVGLRG